VRGDAGKPTGFKLCVGHFGAVGLGAARAKMLEVANIKLGSVLTDVMGKAVAL
jgi:hypothetical protein